MAGSDSGEHICEMIQLWDRPLLDAAFVFWLLPAMLFFDMFLPVSKPTAEIIPLASAAQRVRGKNLRSKRGD